MEIINTIRMCGGVIVIFATLSAISAAVPANRHNPEDMPKDCQGKSYCFEKSPHYPQEEMNKIIQGTLQGIIEVGDQIEYRDGAEKPEDDCKRDTRFEPIYQIIDKEGQLRYVAQSEGMFIQKIRTESCENPGAITSSRYFELHELVGYNFSCSETRIEYSFLVLSLDGTRLEDVDIQGGLPVCCSCRIQVDY